MVNKKEQNKTILFGLQVRKEELKKKLKKAERKLNNTQDLSKEETIADCERIDILNELNDIEESIKRRGGSLED